MTVLETAGGESEADLPYAALIDVLTPVLARLSALPEAQAVALSTALALGPPGAVDRFAVLVATLGLITAASDDRPVLIVVDDLQWVDVASRDALSSSHRGGSQRLRRSSSPRNKPTPPRRPACRSFASDRSTAKTRPRCSPSKPHGVARTC